MEQCVCLLVLADKRLELLKLGEKIEQLRKQKDAADAKVAENEKRRRLDMEVSSPSPSLSLNETKYPILTRGTEF